MERAHVATLRLSLREVRGSDVAIDAVAAEVDGNLMQHISSAKLKLQGGSPIALNWGRTWHFHVLHACA